MSYQPSSLHLSEDQTVKLFGGNPVRLNKDALATEGNVPVLLTKTQLNKIKKSKEKGVGCQIKFSQAQLNEMEKQKMGGGIFDVIKSGVKLVGRLPGIKNLALRAVDYVAPKVIDAAAGLAQGAVNGIAPSVTHDLVNSGFELGRKLGKDRAKELIHGLKTGSGLVMAGGKP